MPYIDPMGILKITAKGQVTLRKEVLEHLGVATGDEVSVEMLPDGKVVVQAAPATDISALFGILKKPGQKRLSIEEINEVIRQGWAGKPE